MTLKQFFRFVEIKTKVASQFPLILGSLFSAWYYGRFDWLAFGLFFVSLLVLDMFTTGLNNLFDARHDRLEKDYARDYQNVILRDELSPKVGEIILLVLLLISLVTGILLVVRTGPVVLLLGMVSFGIAFIYSYGPVPINHTPFGEILSGVTMGGIITFLAVYIHNSQAGWIGLQGEMLQLNLREILRVVLVGSPFILLTANIMLANNMSDLTEDRRNGRYTLPHYIGLEQGKRLFSLNYLACYLIILGLIIFGVLPWTVLLVFVSVGRVYANVRAFMAKVAKSETFIFSVRNYVLIALTYCLGLALALVFL
ncbi:MAG TPA: 1,4-dihydroxy-2-naphthoate polyprenyltransferase [Tissierellia bacterium]|nr:1,4-dihydroxy-2-naphthoate polyprenyltransferase [Tissierellia bacterium]